MSYATENRLCSHVKELRHDAGFTQLELAARAGVAMTTIERMDRGEVIGMKIETLLRVAAALEATPADLLPELANLTEVERLPPKRRRVNSVLRVQPQVRPVSEPGD